MFALFGAKFACNSAIRYPIFRWESCKCCMWESVKNSSVCVHLRAFSRLDLASDSRLMTHQKCHNCETCKKLKGHDSWITIRQKGQSGQPVILRLELMTSPTREWVARTSYFAEKWLFKFLIYPIINTLIPTKCRQLLEKILREKP